MFTITRILRSAAGITSVVGVVLFSSLADAATIYPVGTAGVDFNGAGGPNAAGYASITAGGTDFVITTNGITFDIDGTSSSMANRNRGGASDDLLQDFYQWYTPGGTSPVAVTLSGLIPGSPYIVSFYNLNHGAGASTQTYFEGTTSGTVLGTFTAPGNIAVGPPYGGDFNLFADSAGEILITAVGGTVAVPTERTTINGINVTAIPEPSAIILAGLGLAGLMLRRRV